MADDELVIPQVPEPKPDDSEDVSWALSTAEAMWARGDHLEGIKWVRKAAEAASEAEADMRALELAKVAADLSAMIARRSMAEPPASSRTLPGRDGPTSSQRVPATSRSAAPQPPPAPKPAKPAPPAPPPAPPAPPAAAAAKGRSIPPAPIPLPSKSSPPPGPTSSAKSIPPAPTSSAKSMPPRPVATNVKTQGPAAGKGVLSNRPPPATDKKGRRKSRENLEEEALAAGVLDTAPHPSVDPESALKTLGKTDEHAVVIPESTRTRRRSRPDTDSTVVAPMKELIAQKSTDEWDNSPTQSLAGDEVPSHGDRSTTHMGAAKPAPARSPSVAPHDPGIQTTQAVRVVVFRDANGVHVAPAGTVVSAIKIDAVLVSLDPNADLTAWLTQRDR